MVVCLIFLVLFTHHTLLIFLLSWRLLFWEDFSLQTAPIKQQTVKPLFFFFFLSFFPLFIYLITHIVMGFGLYLIVAGTLITGATNSLLTKYQDNQCVDNCHDLILLIINYLNNQEFKLCKCFLVN